MQAAEGLAVSLDKWPDGVKSIACLHGLCKEYDLKNLKNKNPIELDRAMPVCEYTGNAWSIVSKRAWEEAKASNAH